MDSNIKLSNVIGAPFQDYVLKQFYTRAAKNSTTNRSLDEVLYLANKTAWVRLVSSVNVISNKVEIKKDTFQEITTTQTYQQLGVNGYDDEDSLAKNWILQSGTSKQKGDSIELRYGVSASNAEGYNLVNSSYGLGGTQELGYVPMPGLTSVTVETLGRLGSLRQANINFRVNNLNQLNAIEALYFRLGYSMILEWGHTQYYKNNNQFVVDGPFGIGDPFQNDIRKEEVIQRINAKTREADGNYGGMYGIVTGFNWNATEDGGYDCTLKLIGHGAIMDSLKANQSYTLPEGDIKEYKKQQELLNEATVAKIAELEKKLEEKLTPKVEEEYVVPEPFPKTFDELIELIYKYDESGRAIIDLTNGDLKDYRPYFIVNYAYPLPAYYDIDNKNNSADISRGAKNFIVRIKPEVFNKIPEGKVRDAYIKKFEGWYIQNEGQFVRVRQEGDQLSGDVNLQQLETLLSYFINLPKYGSGEFTTTYFGGFENGLQAGEDTYLEKLSLKQNKRVQFPFDRYTGIQTLIQYADAGEFDGVIGKLFVSLETTYPETNPPRNVELARTYIPTQAEIGDAISAASKNLPSLITRKIQILRDVNPVADIQFRPSTLSGFEWEYYARFSIDVTVPGVPYRGDAQFAESVAKANGIDPNNNKTDIIVRVTVTTNVWSIFSNFLVNNKPFNPEPQKVEEKKEEGGGEVKKVDDKQYDSPEGFSSALQAMLTIVQTASQANAKDSTGVVEFNIANITRKFYQDGALKGVLLDTPRTIGKTTTLTGLPDADALRNKQFDLKNYALKGFNAAAMADNTLYDTIPFVDFESMCYSYVIKYQMGGVEGAAGSVRSPTFISLGYLLAFLNNMCLIYDSNKTKSLGVSESTDNITSDDGTKKRPYIYIDFNPETNFCLTSPQQFSVDPTICMIQLNASKERFGDLFTGGYGGNVVKNLNPAIFDPQKENKINEGVKKFQFKAGDKNRGSLMNILLNTQYLLDLCVQMSNNDPEHAVNLKPFLDQIMIDVNKCLGGINAFRVAYLDESNVVQIVDDQWVPQPAGTITTQATVLDKQQLGTKEATQPETSGKLPLSNATGIPSAEAPGQLTLIGTKSMTREFRFNTSISSKLASKIAISAQAGVGAVNSKDHSPYSHLNLFYEDRYSRSKEDPSKGNAAKESKGSSDQQAANLFNSHVISVYSAFDAYSPKNIQAAKNYYLERMSKVKAADYLTSASPYVSLELEMTIDGISGMIMGNAFTIPNDRLPYTYRGTNGTTKIAFIVTGLVHTIQQNEWLTKIKGQMIKLKNPVGINNAVDQISGVQTGRATIASKKSTAPGNRNCGDIDYSGAKQVPEGESVNSANFSTKYYPGFKFIKGTSDINLEKVGLKPITQDNEIQDDTTLNRFNIGKNSPTPKTFVIHHTAGYEKSAQDVYNVFYCSGNPAQYVVTRDGVIHRFMPDGAYSWHAQNHNTDSIGVEVVARTETGENPVNEAQIKAVARLAQYLGFKKSQLRYHGQYENRMNDEGTVIYNYIINNL